MSLSAAQHLASFGVTVDQAREFIFANLGNLQAILSVADQYGVTNDMLAEIVGGGYTGAQVQAYFGQNGLDSSVLEPDVSQPGEQYALVPEDIFELAALLQLNTNTSTDLATAALRAEVIGRTNSTDYWSLFDPSGIYGAYDGMFSTSELGFSHLGALPATQETIESLYYGTLIATFKALDEGEAAEIESYLDVHESAMLNGDQAAMDGYVDLIVSVFSDQAATPVLDDSHINDAIVESTVALVALAQYEPSLFHSLLML